MHNTRVITSLLLSLSASALVAQNTPPPAPPMPATPPAAATPAAPAEPVDMQAVSYIIGADLGQKLKTSSVDASLEQLSAGLKDALAGAEPKYSQEEQQKIMTAFQSELRGKMEKKQAALAIKNTKLAEDFLAENGKKPGVITTASGLQYQVIKEGNGPKPVATDKVKAIYKGQLISGTVFDDSKGQPREFPVNGVVPGWQEALPMMATGSQWKLFVPPALGYGPAQRGPVIEPNSVLIFEIELVEITKAPVAVTPPVSMTPPGGTPGAPATPGTPPRKPIVAVSPPISIPPLNKENSSAPKPDGKKKE
ncbi:MAG: FKBP-type peptidyl-prolyl cis-trans isomerase [Verrucomicrobiota bacterium]